MTDNSSDRRAAFRAAIERFLQERCDAKLDKLPEDDPKRGELLARFDRATWITDAARRVRQIQVVTHTLKATHPNARGTSLFCRPDTLPAHLELGTHVVGNRFTHDVTGNAGAQDVFDFLRQQVEGKALLDWMLIADADLKATLSNDVEQAESWIEAFTDLVKSGGTAASHMLAKQVYWLAGDDPCRNDHYHLLAPLYASSLAHIVFQAIEHDRFSEEASAARQARRDREDHPIGVAEYPNLAIQRLGGMESNKQLNVSLLNKERRGKNYLLSCSPPHWKTRKIHELWHVESAFQRFGRSPDVRNAAIEWRRFLESDPSKTLEVREAGRAWLIQIIDGIVQQAARLQQELPPGWSLDAHCKLNEAECAWLDPHRCNLDPVFRTSWMQGAWMEEVAHRFAGWLNQQLSARLPMGDDEHREWKRAVLDELEEYAAVVRDDLEESAQGEEAA